MKILQKLLRALAVKTLLRYRPRVVAVAGSVGKTSTRRAIAAVLRRSFRVRESHGNFNNEIGVPLAILGEAKTGGRNPFAWLAVLARGAWMAWGPRRMEEPHVLVLEMATDSPGDLAYLTGIAKPDIAVVTAVSEEHSEFLGGLDEIAEEEGAVVEALPADGTAVLNSDDPRVAAMAARAGKARILTYGLSPSANIKARAVTLEQALGTPFLRFDLVVEGGAGLPVTIAGAIGAGNVYAAMAAAAAAAALGVDTSLIPYGLAEYHPPPGRLRAMPGVKSSTLIDDTYNSSPRAAELALQTLMEFPSEGGRRIAVMGDMLELGPLTEEAHMRVGETAARVGVDVLIGVGSSAAFMCQEAVAAGFSEDRVFHLHDAVEAGHFLQDRIKAGDIILVKGSRGMRMERAVKELMAEPERAGELLVGS